MTLPESDSPCLLDLMSVAKGSPRARITLPPPRKPATVPPVTDALSLRDLNAADRAAFARALGAIFEGSPWVAERAWAARPYATVRDLHAAMVAAARDSSREAQIALLRAHPDLAGRAARAGAMSESSVAEQASAGLDRLTGEEFARFHRLNAAYREKFGFPFIIAVRHHEKSSILAAFERRLGHSREEEIEAALAEVAAIAWLRLEALVSAP
jgi:2-oxo-4-hydroxy-4-carboxy-5-ureidoimidazoline decarboxylase